MNWLKVIEFLLPGAAGVAFSTALAALWSLRQKVAGREFWILVFIVISSGTDILNLYFFFRKWHNIHIINFYCLVEPLLFFLIWVGRPFQSHNRRRLGYFFIVYLAYLLMWMYESSIESDKYVAFSAYIYLLFFSFVFVNALADTIIHSKIEKNRSADFYFFLGILLYLTFDIIMGVFDNIYEHFSPEFFKITGWIKELNMLAVYGLYIFSSLWRILKKTS